MIVVYDGSQSPFFETLAMAMAMGEQFAGEDPDSA
jgi:hypothetical protein|tara:strand:+ start:292 stop:396 length:105 start_codon:yes stop_codon:yes gene_type:complete